MLRLRRFESPVGVCSGEHGIDPVIEMRSVAVRRAVLRSVGCDATYITEPGDIAVLRQPGSSGRAAVWSNMYPPLGRPQFRQTISVRMMSTGKRVGHQQ